MSFLSGFQGSNGQILITATKALLWTDGRYFLQAEKELAAGWTMMKIQAGVPRYFDWLLANSPPGAKIGFDPYLIPANIATKRIATFKESNLHFVPVVPNLANIVWSDRPQLSKSPVFLHEVVYAGQTLEQKLEKLTATFEGQKAEVLFTSLLDEIAWVLNLRGRDIEYNPVFFSYLLVRRTGGKTTATLFIDPEKVEEHVKTYLTTNGVSIEPYETVEEALRNIEEKVIVDADELNLALYNAIRQPIHVAQVITKLKGTKSDHEATGMRDCHIRDGRALCRYLAWLEHELSTGRSDLTEYTAALKLEQFRSEEPLFQGLSFETISAVGANAAIIHFSPKEETAVPITNKEIYLLDSGGQYSNGTTDVTRTVHFGEPSEREKEFFTRVLLGNLDVCRLKWPFGLSGGDIDVLARRWLWDVSLDYNHGTGHGVGYFLNVHEGPHGIGRYSADPLQAGVIVSDEPGYYESGHFGIRIEDVLLVKKIEGTFLTFENLTMCPYDRKLLDMTLLARRDLECIDAYHAKVRETLAPLLLDDEVTLAWLQRATAPLLPA